MQSVEGIFIPKLQMIIDSAILAEEKCSGYPNQIKSRPDIAYELLIILNLADDLIEVINPGKQAQEYFGIPKEALINAKHPSEIISNSGLDFTNWFAEKVTYIKLGVKRAIKYWEMDPETLQLSENAPITKEDYISDGIFSSLHQIKTYAETVFGMIEKERG